MITKGLVIDEPWISKILNGEKVWEMRSQGANHRGTFGLIRKGSGQVVGIANLKGVSGPYTNEELYLHQAKHQVGRELFERPDYQWRVAWELADVQRLATPVFYQHKSGAVTWVILNPDASQSIADQLNGNASSVITPRKGDNLVDQEIDRLFGHAAPVTETEIKQADFPGRTNPRFAPDPIIQPVKAEPLKPPAERRINAEHVSERDAEKASQTQGQPYVPVARDGSQFLPANCNNKGTYTVGDKGDEKKFTSYQDALCYLKKMPTAKWRRPNAKGNWGIVSAIDWSKPNGD